MEKNEQLWYLIACWKDATTPEEIDQYVRKINSHIASEKERVREEERERAFTALYKVYMKSADLHLLDIIEEAQKEILHPQEQEEGKIN